jgi:hypothetical protein
MKVPAIVPGFSLVLAGQIQAKRVWRSEDTRQSSFTVATRKLCRKADIHKSLQRYRWIGSGIRIYFCYGLKYLGPLLMVHSHLPDQNTFETV